VGFQERLTDLPVQAQRPLIAGHLITIERVDRRTDD
jgi:hypothetical protein